MRIFNALFIVIILTVSFFTFKAFSVPLAPPPPSELAAEMTPSMVPGAHAVRPLATGQNEREDAYAEDESLKAPSELLFGTEEPSTE